MSEVLYVVSVPAASIRHRVKGGEVCGSLTEVARRHLAGLRDRGRQGDPDLMLREGNDGRRPGL